MARATVSPLQAFLDLSAHRLLVFLPGLRKGLGDGLGDLDLASATRRVREVHHVVFVDV